MTQPATAKSFGNHADGGAGTGGRQTAGIAMGQHACAFRQQFGAEFGHALAQGHIFLEQVFGTGYQRLCSLSHHRQHAIKAVHQIDGCGAGVTQGGSGFTQLRFTPALFSQMCQQQGGANADQRRATDLQFADHRHHRLHRIAVQPAFTVRQLMLVQQFKAVVLVAQRGGDQLFHGPVSCRIQKCRL